MMATVLLMGLTLLGCGKTAENGDNVTTESKTDQNSTELTTGKQGKEVNLYVSNANADDFDKKVVTLDEVTPENIIAALEENGAIPETVTVLSFSEDETGLTLDLSKEYQEYIQGSGTAGEMMAVGSVVNTFLETYDAECITILVEGAAWDSGHAEYEGPLGKMEL